MKRIVLPGELLSEEGKKAGEHVFVRNGKLFSDVMGIASTDGPVAFVVPLSGKYLPKPNDWIIGLVAQTLHNGWLVDINGFWLAFVSNKEMREPLRNGSIISAKIMNVSDNFDVELGFVRVFFGGEVLHVSPVKVPRMIGKNNSMLEVLKSGVNGHVMIGRNGRVWVKGGNVPLLLQALDKIDKEAHTEHLTEAIASFLKQAQAKGMKGEKEAM